MRNFTAFLFLLLVSSILEGQVLLSEDFNAGFPSSWTIVNGGSSPATWFRTAGGYNGQYLDGSEFMFVNSDAAGNIPAVWMHEELVSPSINTSIYPNLRLEFDHYFNFIGLTDSGHVEVYDGSNWNRVVSYAASTGAFSNPAHVQLNVGSYSNANFRFRFVYDDNTTWAWYWAIDNVRLIAPSNLDASVEKWLSPATNGRQLTSLEFGTTEQISISIKNQGVATLTNVPVYFQADLGAIQGPEIVAGPILPGQSVTHVFAATANLSALGMHELHAWTALVGDANASNDTADNTVRHLANPPLAFPHCINFEALNDTTLQHNVVGLQGLDEMDYATNIIGAGRLRTRAGQGFAHAGNRAITFDRNPSGSPNAINFATFTWNMAGFNASSDVFMLDLWIMEHGDEVQLADSVWIRGCDTCNWLRILAWNQLTGGANGTYFNNAPINVSNVLLARGQNFSSSFQLRIGQEDNFPALNLTSSDGMTFDDICLRRILPINAGVTALVSPIPNGLCGDTATTITVQVRNLGTDPLSNIPVEVQVSGGINASFQDTLVGPLAPNTAVNLTIGSFNSTVGSQFMITAWTAFPGDLSILDDSLLTWVHLAPELSAPIATADTVCIGGYGWAYVAQLDSSLVYEWFDSGIGGNFLGEGDSLAIGPITSPTAYFVEPRSVTNGHLGPLNNQFGTWATYNSFSDGLIFDAFIDFELDSVTVFPEDTGLVVIVLRNAASQTLDSISILVQPSFAFEPTRIPVGIEILAGNGYRISARGSTVLGLYRNNVGANYPYNLTNVARITGPINGLGGYYYFFYDWILRYTYCPGPRTLVTADTTSILPQANFSFTTNGLDASFANSSLHSNAWHWDFGDGTTSTMSNPQHSYAIDGNYAVCLIVSNPCDNDTFCDTVTVNCLPLQPGIAYVTNELFLQINDTTANAIGQLWDFGDGQTGNAASEFHTYAADGQYWVCLRNWNICNDTFSLCDSITVCAAMNAAFSANQNGAAGLGFDFNDLSSGTPTAWAWSFGDGNTSSLQMPNHVYAASGSYSVRLIVTNLCGISDTVSQMIGVVGNLGGMEANFKLWPNPANDVLNIEFSLENAAPIRIARLDLQGKVLQREERQGKTGNNVFQFSLKECASGAYFMELESEGWIQRKLVIVKQL